jgi:hypothetical protein
VTLAHRADGKLLYFLAQGANWVPDADVNIELIEVKNGSVRTGWKVFDERAVVLESYDPAGVLLSITDARGRSAVLTYSTASTPPAIAPRAGLVIAAERRRGEPDHGVRVRRGGAAEEGDGARRQLRELHV